MSAKSTGFWGGGVVKFSEMDCDDRCMAVEFIKKCCILSFKWVSCMVHEISLKAVIKFLGKRVLKCT